MTHSEAFSLGRTALAMCGYIAFGDVRSIELRINAAQAECETLTGIIKALAPYRDKESNKMRATTRQQIKLWKKAIAHARSYIKDLLKMSDNEIKELNNKLPTTGTERV